MEKVCLQKEVEQCCAKVKTYPERICCDLEQVYRAPNLHHACRGSAGAVALVCYYTSPLSTIVRVVKTKDSSLLHPPLCIMNFVNMCLWLSYGVAIHNPFIW